MILSMICAALVGPALAAAPCLRPGETEIVQLKEKDAVAYGEGGVPMFNADRDFTLAFAGNPEGRVFEFDKVKRRVRISADSSSQVWLACDDLQPTASCVEMAEAATAGPTTPRKRLARGGGIPNCPGDPRCPKLGSK